MDTVRQSPSAQGGLATLVRMGRRSYLVRRSSGSDIGAPESRLEPWASPLKVPFGLDHAVSRSGVDVAWLENHLAFGGRKTALLDMQGIDSFMFGRAKIFDDRQARQLAATFLGIDSGLYLRVGAAGAPPSSSHPGGEVLEEMFVRQGETVGEVRSLAGHLPAGRQVTTSMPLRVDDRVLTTRSIYSHTAYLPKAVGAPSTFLLGPDDIAPLDEVDLLAWASNAARCSGHPAFSIRMRVTAGPASSRPVTVVGRALRRLPNGPLRDLDAAAQIASEVEFELRPGQSLVGFGTYRPRHEPAWEDLRGGKPYEPAGHVHFRLEGGAHGEQHEVAHLRSLLVPAGVAFAVLIDPVEAALRVDPVRVVDDWVESSASGHRLLPMSQVTDGRKESA